MAFSKVGRLAPATGFAYRPCGAKSPLLPQCLQHCTCASGGPFFSALPEKNGEKRGALGRVDFYRTATTEAPKFAASCKRTPSPARNYVCPARQRTALTCKSLPQNKCKQCPQLKNQEPRHVFAGTADPRNQLSSKSGNSAAPCPAVTRNIYSSRLRRNRTAVPSSVLPDAPASFSPGGLIQKRGPQPPLLAVGGSSRGPIGRPP